MRKIVFSAAGCLAIYGAATAFTGADAHAEQTARKPVLLAQAGPPRGQDMNRERQPSCSDITADKQEEMRWLESRLSLTGAQQPLFARWRQVAMDIARRNQSECTAHQRNANRAPSLIDGIAEEEAMLRGRLADLQAERPVLEAFYRSLSPGQRSQLEQQDNDNGPGNQQGGDPWDRPPPRR
jgi:hypothetical protein